MLVYITIAFLIAIIASNLPERNHVALDVGKGAVYPRCDLRDYLHNHINQILITLILVCVAGLRYDVGTDYMAYYREFSYHSFSYDTIPHLKKYAEPGFDLLYDISKLIWNDSVVFFFLTSLLTVGLCVNQIDKYSDDFAMGILLYLYIGAWHGSFNAMRQYLASAILFSGHRFIIDRRFGLFALTVFLATLFHRTALIFFPIYFVCVPHHEVRNLLLIILGSIVMAYSYGFFFDIMSELKGSEQSQYEYMNQSVNIFRVLFSCAPVAIMVCFPHFGFTSKENAFYFKLLIVNAAFMIATARSAYLARIGIYTDIYATIGFPLLVNLYRDPQKKREIRFLILLLYFFFFLYEIYVRASLHNFRWIFQGREFLT